MGTILFAQVENVQVLKLSGDVRVTLGPTISRYLESIGGRYGAKVDYY